MTVSKKFTGSHSLTRVEKGNLCSGCGGCAFIARGSIEMQMISPGFLRPVQNAPLNKEQDERIARVCPGLGQSVKPGGRNDHVLWGPYLGMYTGFSTDPDLRYTASSGGALSAILVHLLQEGKVDGVVQTGAATSPPYANVPVVSQTSEEVLKAAGSRYAPSSPLSHLAEYLDSGRRYAFVAKPCDVAALRELSDEDPRISKTFPYVISFFCAGVPSQAGAERVLEKLGAEAADTVAFRYRGNGWPGRAVATISDGNCLSMTYHESWGGILSDHVQHRCKICADGTGTAADIVCADAWHCDKKGYPLFEERDGISLIVTRTDIGAQLLDDALSAGRVSAEPFDPAGLAKMQPGQSRRRQALIARLAGLRLLARPIPRYKGLRLIGAARQASLPWLIRNFLGMVRRVLTGKAP